MTRRAGLALAAFLFLGLGAALFQISRSRCHQLVGSAICRVETNEKIVALTFDDGPTPGGVAAVRAALEPRGIRATFFLVGSDIARTPDLAHQLQMAGHELGNHSFSHSRMIGRLPGFHTREIAETDALLRKAGATPTLFRPPYGKRLIGLPIAVNRAGYRMITWDVDDGGLESGTAEAYASAILKQVKPGSIILIHPMYSGNGSAREALPLILDGLAARGYRITTVSGLISAAS